jgi:hypothetical protein
MVLVLIIQIAIEGVLTPAGKTNENALVYTSKLTLESHAITTRRR